jgi:hypothetical protein
MRTMLAFLLNIRELSELVLQNGRVVDSTRPRVLSGAGSWAYFIKFHSSRQIAFLRPLGVDLPASSILSR